MLTLPFHLQYPLTCLQRLTPHLRIWGRAWTVFVLVIFAFFSTQTIVAACSLSLLGIATFGFLALFVFVPNRGLFVGLIDVLFVPVRHMDVIVDENAAHLLIGSERWCLFLDGITDLRQFRDDTWTIQHFNGWVLHIGSDSITDEQIEHLRQAMERGRTQAGVAAVIERGRWM